MMSQCSNNVNNNTIQQERSILHGNYCSLSLLLQVGIPKPLFTRVSLQIVSTKANVHARVKAFRTPTLMRVQYCVYFDCQLDEMYCQWKGTVSDRKVTGSDATYLLITSYCTQLKYTWLTYVLEILLTYSWDYATVSNPPLLLRVMKHTVTTVCWSSVSYTHLDVYKRQGYSSLR